MKKFLVIQCFETDEIVEKIDVTDKSERMIDRIESGININLNHDWYFTRIIEE